MSSIASFSRVVINLDSVGIFPIVAGSGGEEREKQLRQLVADVPYSPWRAGD